jgi:hypothetical protein
MDEIKRLASGDSRLIICGRPSAFLSEKEHRGALQDSFTVGAYWMKDSTFAGFNEVSLTPLNQEEIHIFLARYLGYLRTTKEIGERAANKVLAQMVSNGAGRQLFDLARRPVQLRMLATVLPEWNKPLDRLDRTLLYDHFISQLIERETKKRARESISVSERRKFAKELAYYMWGTNGKAFIRADEIPDSLFRSISAPAIPSSDLLRRELVVAAALEVKLPDLLYFPHRSLQEFLVAEKLSERITQSATMEEFAGALSTPEVSEFFTGLADVKSLSSWAYATLLQPGATLYPIVEETLWNVPTAWNYIANRASEHVESPWPELFYLRNIAYHRMHLKLGDLTGRTRTNRGKAVPRQYKIPEVKLADLLSHHRESSAVIALHALFVFYFGFRLEKAISPWNSAWKFEKHLGEIVNLLHERGYQDAKDIIGSFALYKGSRSIQLGRVRTAFQEYYMCRPHLPSMYSKGKLNPMYDFGPTFSCPDAKFSEIESTVLRARS